MPTPIPSIAVPAPPALRARAHTPSIFPAAALLAAIQYPIPPEPPLVPARPPQPLRPRSSMLMSTGRPEERTSSVMAPSNLERAMGASKKSGGGELETTWQLAPLITRIPLPPEVPMPRTNPVAARTCLTQSLNAKRQMSGGRGAQPTQPGTPPRCKCMHGNCFTSECEREHTSIQTAIRLPLEAVYRETYVHACDPAS